MLEISGASLDGLAVGGAVAACPSLADLTLLKCQCSGYVPSAAALTWSAPAPAPHVDSP